MANLKQMCKEKAAQFMESNKFLILNKSSFSEINKKQADKEKLCLFPMPLNSETQFCFVPLEKKLCKNKIPITDAIAC